MKGFFEKLFGRNSPPETPEKRAQAAALNPSQESTVEAFA
jgi:hypothetical protein